MMKKYPLYNIVSLLLILTLLFNTVVIPVTAEGDNNNREIENPLNVDYVLPAWGEDTDETSEQTKPAVYRDGKILIYHYEQLLKIGTNEAVTDTDYITNQLGNGNTIAGITYSSGADYEIVQDIPLPRHTKWNLPVDFNGTVTGTLSPNAQLYDKAKDTIYLYNPLQTTVMADEDSETEIVMTGDMDVSTFGTGNVIIPDGDTHKLTYSGQHNYVIAKGFSSYTADLSPSVINYSSSQYDGRDFQGQVIKEINGIEYILIGNQEQLRAIGSNDTVYTAIYRSNNMIYGGDADLLRSQNGTDDYNFHNFLSGWGYGVYQKDETDILGVHHNMGEIKKIDESYKTDHKYSTKENYIIFRDIDLGGESENTSTYWTPLMFSGSMTGAIAENGEKIWDGDLPNGSNNITAARRAVISNVYVNQSQPIEVNEYIGIGFFATITNELSASDLGLSAGTAKVKNLELNQVEIHNTATTATKAERNTLLNIITSGLGMLLDGVLLLLLTVVSFGSFSGSFEDALGYVLDARMDDPTIFSTGAFAGRIVGDVEIDNCSVTGSVIVENHKNNTGGFVGYVNGMTEYSGLSKALGSLTTFLSRLLNIIPGLGLGDLITILLDKAVPLRNLIPTGYLEPHIKNCTVENLGGKVGQTDTNSSGGFVGSQIGTQIENCAVKNSDYIIEAANYGGGFSGAERDAIVQGTLDGLGVDLLSISQILSDILGSDNFQTESMLKECRIENSTVTVNGGSYLGGFVGAMAASYAIDCDIKGTVSNPLKVSGTGSNIGGFAGEATIGWANSIGKNEADNSSLLSVVRQVLTGVLSSDSSANKKLLALVGLVPSAIMGCQTDMSTVNVSGGNSFVGGIVGNGEGILLTESSAAYMNKLTYWENLTEKTERENYLTNLESVISGGNYVGGAAGEVGAVSLAGVLDSAVSAGSFLSFTVSKVTVTGIDTGYTVISDGNYSNENIKGDFVSGGFGMACGGTINRVHLQKVKKIEAANNKAAGFVGAAGPGDLVGAGNDLTINLLGLNNVLNISNLLSVGQAIHVTISDSDVTGIETGFTVEAKGSGNTNPGYQYLASGFIAQSNSTEVINCHTYYLKWVKAANVQGYSGGFIGTSQTGGLTDVSDVGGVRSLLSLEGGLLGAISYLIPSYTNCTVTFVDGGYVSADIAGGFAADMQSGKVDNSNDDSNDPKWTKTMQELYDPDAVNATGDLQKQFAVFNIDSVRGQTYGGGFAGKVRSGALAGSSGGISILGNTDLNINISDLLGVINAYVPFVRNAGVYSENGFVVAADEIRSNDSHSGSAGGFAGYMSGAQISYCDVYKLKHTEVTPPDNLESISGTSYFDNTKSKYAVVGGHYAGGYVGNMDIGDAASVGSGLQVFGTGIQLTDVLSALSVVVSTIEHSDVQGAGGGFSVIADKTVNDLKVGMSGGYAGTVCGGHIQNSHCKNFYYIIGEEMAGGYVGNMEPGNVANLMYETNVGLLGGLLGNILNVDSSLASLAEDFVPTIRNSTTSCVPCGGAVRAQAASDSGHQRGCAGGFCGHNEGGHIWGLNTSTWEKENDGNVLGHDFGHNAEGNYIGEQHICTAWRIRSVYGYEYAGGFTGFMESADTADTGNISLLGSLIKVDNLLGALSAVYPTEKNTAVYGPLRNIDIDTWNGWVNYIGRFGGYGAELANEGTASNQTELNQKLLKYIYGLNVVAGRTAHDQEGMPITEGGNAGGYVGYMVSGVISNGQTHDIRHIKAMRSSGGYAGRMKTGGAANFGSTSILGLNLNIGQLVKAVQVFVPTIRSGSVQGWQSGMTVTATGTDLVHNCGYAGGYVGSGYGAQIWGDKGVDNGPSSGCNVINLKFVRGTNAVGGFVGMATAASVVDANTNASNGLLQSILNSLISTPSDLVSVLDATITTVRQVEIITESQTNDSNDKEKRPNNKEFGFIIEDCNGVVPRFAGGFAGSLEASVIGSRKGESRIIVNDLRGVYGQYYAGGFVGLADVGSVASVSSDTSTGGGTSILNGLVAAGNVDVLDIFRTYIYYSEVNGVEEGFIVRASTSAEQGILSETRYSGCAGGFGGGMMNGSVKNSKVTKLNTVSGVNYNGGFIGHMGKNGAADIDSANVANDLLAGLNAGILDIFGTVVNECEVHGIDAGAVIFSDKGPQPIAGGFAGYGDLSQIKNSKVNSLKQVYSDEIAGGFIGKTNMEYLVSTEVDSTLLNIVLRILNILLKILLIPDLESSDLLDTNKLLSLIGVSEIPLGLKLLSDGDLLYVNLLGLKIGVSLVKEQGNGTTGTAIVTIGDSSVELPYTNGAFDTENPEVVINLLKGNTTRVLNCSVTGIDIGYDVYGGGASNIADGTNVDGYAGGFVGYNNEGRLFDNKMIYCDVVRGTSGKIGHFSGVSVLNTVYDHTSDEIERNNEYHIYRSVGEDYKYALTEEGTLIAGSTEDTGTSVKYNRFDMMHYDSNSPIKKYDDWKDAYISQTNQVTANSQRIGVYKSDAKAVLMSDTPTKENSRSLIPETAERQDPCDENIHITIQKIWEDFDNERGNRPDTIKVRLIQHWLNPDGTVYKEGGQPKTVFYTDTNVIPDADSNGWFTLTRSEHERQDSSTWVRVIEGLPSGQYTTDSLTGMKTAVYYYYYTVEEQKINDYTAVIKYHDSNTAATIANSHGISVFKTDENENGLSGAVFDLYYQETTTPPAYTFNEPVIIDDDEELPEGETYDVKLATVVTGADGKQEKIIWLKLNDEENDVDKQYLDHELSDIWNEENNPDAKATEVRVIVDANKCYWKEISAPAGYKLQKEKIPVTSVTTKVIDEKLPGQIILKKTAKEKVGTNDIGAAIEGAKFKLVKVNNDNTLGNCVPLAKRKNKFEYEYYDPTQSNTVNIMTASEEYETNNGSLVRYNVMTDDTPPVYDISKALTTNAGGKLKIDNLPCGDYCLEEVQAPKGYSHTDSHTGENRKIYFSVGNNTIIKNIKCSDEMNEAYIRLFEHIDEYRPDEWGNPTFIFKIKQTGYYEWQEPEEVGGEPEWELTSATNGKEISVALTVDENGKWPEGLTSHSNPDYDYNNWYEEATKEPEYKGMYHIGEDGKIRLEPGTYEITRIPVSRYEFVENTWKLDSDDDTVYEGPHRTETEKMTVTIPAGKTATVHYYDRVEYYDKFSHEDTKINKFYTIDDTTKKNKTVKGIRIEDYHRKNGDTDENGIMNVKATDLTICKIMSDGSEIKMTDTEKASLTGTNFIVSYKYDSTSGDAESFGHQENANDNDFSYNNSAEDEDEPGKYPSIVIKNAQRYTNGVYTLTAIYTEQTINFTTTFDIVFSQ